MILDGLGVPFETIDITLRGNEKHRDFMRENATNERCEGVPLPPQFFIDDQYLGNYLDFEDAVEDNQLPEFLRLVPNAVEGGSSDEVASDKTKSDADEEEDEDGDEEEDEGEGEEEDEDEIEDEGEEGTSEYEAEGEVDEDEEELNEGEEEALAEEDGAKKQGDSIKIPELGQSKKKDDTTRNEIKLNSNKLLEVPKKTDANNESKSSNDEGTEAEEEDEEVELEDEEFEDELE